MATYMTPVVFSDDMLCIGAAQPGDIFPPALIPVSAQEGNLLRLAKDGLVATADNLISAEADNPLVSGAAGLRVDMEKAVAEDDKVLSVADNKIRTTLSLEFTRDSDLQLRGNDGKIIGSVRLPVIPGLPVVVEYLADVMPPEGSVVIGGVVGQPGNYLHMRFLLNNDTLQDVFINFAKIFSLNLGDGLAFNVKGAVTVRPATGGGIIVDENGVAVSKDYIRAVADSAVAGVGTPLPGGGIITDARTGMLKIDCGVVQSCVRGDTSLAASLIKPGGGLTTDSQGRLAVSCSAITPCIQGVVDGAVEPVETELAQIKISVQSIYTTATDAGALAAEAAVQAQVAQGVAAHAQAQVAGVVDSVEAASDKADEALAKAEQALTQQPDLSGYLPLSGGSMSGNISFGRSEGVELGGARLRGDYGLSAGGVFNIASFSIDLLADVDDKSLQFFADLAGGQPYAALTIPKITNIPLDTQVLTYKYIRDNFLTQDAGILTALEQTATEAQTTADEALEKAEQALTQQPDMSDYLPLSGGTMTGALTLGENNLVLSNRGGAALNILNGSVWTIGTALRGEVHLRVAGAHFDFVKGRLNENEGAGLLLPEVPTYVPEDRQVAPYGYLKEHFLMPSDDGVLSKEKGGTGRTDGAAADVVVAGVSGNILASSVGQIGQAPRKGDIDLNTLVNAGVYHVSSLSGAVKHQPYIINTECNVFVQHSVVYIGQILVSPTKGEIWTRRSGDTGASWSGWVPISSNMGNVTIYISKSGSDLNTGLESAYPVLTIERAIQIARGLLKNGVNTYAAFCFGAGDWGDVNFREIPFRIILYPFDKSIPTAYSSTLPVMGELSVYSCYVDIYGIMFKKGLYTAYGGQVYYNRGYKRTARLLAQYGGAIYVGSQNEATNVIDFVQYPNATNTYCIQAQAGGKIYFDNYIHIRLAENITGVAFLRNGANGYIYMVNGAFVVDSSSYTFTGRKFELAYSSCIFTNQNGWFKRLEDLPAILKSLPGTVDGVANYLAMVNGAIVGYDSYTNYVAKTGDTMSGPLKSTLGTQVWASMFQGTAMLANTLESGTERALPIFRVPAADGYFLTLSYGNAIRLVFLPTNEYTGQMIPKFQARLLDSSGNSSFPGLVRSEAGFGINAMDIYNTTPTSNYYNSYVFYDKNSVITGEFAHSHLSTGTHRVYMQGRGQTQEPIWMGLEFPASGRAYAFAPVTGSSPYAGEIITGSALYNAVSEAFTGPYEMDIPTTVTELVASDSELGQEILSARPMTLSLDNEDNESSSKVPPFVEYERPLTEEEKFKNLRTYRNIKLFEYEAEVAKLQRKIRQANTQERKDYLTDCISLWDAYADALCDLPKQSGAPWDGGGVQTPWPEKPVCD